MSQHLSSRYIGKAVWGNAMVANPAGATASEAFYEAIKITVSMNTYI